MTTNERQPARASTPDHGPGEFDQSTRTVATLLRLISDPTRLRILRSIAEGERHVAELSSSMNRSRPAISHHLALLRHADLIVPPPRG